MDTKAQNIYLKLLPDLSDTQKAFIEARFTVSSDTEAANIAGVSRQTVHRWRKNNDTFLRAYDLAVTQQEQQEQMNAVVSLSEEAQEVLMKDQLEWLTVKIPQLLERELEIALSHSVKDADALTAIKHLLSILGFDSENMKPADLRDRRLSSIINVMMPVIVSEAKSRGLDVPDMSFGEVIDGDYKTVFDDSGDEVCNLPDLWGENS